MNSTESGFVVIEVEGVNYTAGISNKTAKLDVSGLTVGTHEVKVYYGGDSYYGEANPITGMIVVNDKLPSVITIDDASLVIGKDTTFTAKLNNVSGGVNFTVNGADTDTVTVAAGSYTVTASFAGNTTHKAASTTRVFNVTKADVVVTINGAELTIGKSVTFTGKVDGVDNDKLTFTVNGATNATVLNVSAGTYIVVARFAGNDTHNAGIANKTFTIAKLDSEIIGVASDEVFVGSNSTITVTMKNNESGFVIISIDGVNYTTAIKDKVATLKVALGLGLHNVVVSYAGDYYYNAAESVSAAVNVKDKLPSNIVINDADLTPGHNVTFTAKLNDVDYSDLVFSVNGKYNATVNPLLPATYYVVATFEGNETHKAATANRTFVVDKLQAEIISVGAVPVPIGSTSTINIAMAGNESDFVVV